MNSDSTEELVEQVESLISSMDMGAVLDIE
jgi:hypothetical protein